MSGLLGLLDMGAGAIAAQNSAAATTGRNIANVGTVGYTKETSSLESQLAAPLVGGVSANDPSHVDDALLSKSERDASSATGNTDAMASALGDLETTLSDSSSSVSNALGTFFGSLQSLEASPSDSTLRSQVVSSAQTVAKQLSTASSNVASAQADSDSRIADDAKQATALAAQIAGYNKAIGGSSDPVLKDKRDVAAAQLAKLVGGKGRIDPDGQMRFVLGGGTVLVDGPKSYTVSAKPDATLNNHLGISVVDGTHVSNVTSTLDGGAIAGEISFRDGTAQTTANRLDQLAYDLSSAVNNVHKTYAGADGVKGRDLFTQPTTVSGAAKAMAVNSVIVADPTKLGVQAVGSGASDNTGASALAALSTSKVASGSSKTLTDESISIVGDVGAQAQTATAAQTLAGSRADAIASMRDSLSGVSTEDELAALNKIQAASQAATKFVSTVSDMLSSLITNL